MYAVTSRPLLRRTRTHFRLAEFGFFGFLMSVFSTTPFMKGLPSMARDRTTCRLGGPSRCISSSVAIWRRHRNRVTGEAGVFPSRPGTAPREPFETVVPANAVCPLDNTHDTTQTNSLGRLSLLVLVLTAGLRYSRNPESKHRFM